MRKGSLKWYLAVALFSASIASLLAQSVPDSISVPNVSKPQLWTLKQCIARATGHNTDVQSLRLTLQANRLMLEKSKLDYLPTLSAYSDYQLTVSRSLDPANYSFIENAGSHNVGAGLNLETVLFDGFRRQNTIRRNGAELEASSADLAALQNDVTLSVILGYMNILLYREIVNSVKQQIAISQSNIEQAERLLQEGMIAEEKKQNLLVQLDNENYSLAEAEGNLANAIISLCLLLDISDYEAFDVADDYPSGDLALTSKEGVIMSALSLPQVDAAKYRVLSAEYGLQTVKSELYPSLSFRAFLGSSFSSLRKKFSHTDLSSGEQIYDNYPLFSQLSNHRNGYVALTVSYPIFNLFHTRKNIALARNGVMQAHHNLQTVKKTLKNRIYQIYSEVETARRKWEASESSASHAESILFYAVEKLRLGVMTPNDYVFTKNSLLVSRIQANRARYEYCFKLELLNFYCSQAIAQTR